MWRIAKTLVGWWCGLYVCVGHGGLQCLSRTRGGTGDYLPLLISRRTESGGNNAPRCSDQGVVYMHPSQSATERYLRCPIQA